MEPIFRAIHKDDPEIEKAHYKCSDTINQFVEMVKNRDAATYMAKLRFRDPDLSEKEGKDHLFYLWLSDVMFHPNEGLLSGVFFEIPSGFEKWHQVGKRLGFEPEDVFDWMVIDSKEQMKGGFTIRVTRSRLTSDEEKKKYDEYIGVKHYLPL
jgi:uncharacterized protein YegJ (DUF2314 family)